MAEYPQLFEGPACDAANKACKPLDLQAAIAKTKGDWDGYVKAVRAGKVLWLDTYLAAAKDE
jgi:hypothetical protein